MESPATALRRHRTEVRRLLRAGFTKYALMKTAHAQWRDTGRGTSGISHRGDAARPSSARSFVAPSVSPVPSLTFHLPPLSK